MASSRIISRALCECSVARFPTMPETKRPADHKAKATPPPSRVQKVTLDGHEYEIDPARLDDLHVLEAIEDGRWIAVLRHTLGAEQWQQFYDNHADENGRVTTAKFGQIMQELEASDLRIELGN